MRRFELVALDRRAGTAALLTASGGVRVFRLDVESDDGLRLLSVGDDAAIFEVRFRKAADQVIYRLKLGERLVLRAPMAHRRGGIRVIEAIRPPVQSGSHDSAEK